MKEYRRVIFIVVCADTDTHQGTVETHHDSATGYAAILPVSQAKDLAAVQRAGKLPFSPVSAYRSYQMYNFFHTFIDLQSQPQYKESPGSCRNLRTSFLRQLLKLNGCY
jgi:hypothetical protein